uniref:Uncharacterized protein n=1 Tax=Eutreptiella gymnastica TaxID=73025 RepID=A0A7S4LAA2_9EUGL
MRLETQGSRPGSAVARTPTVTFANNKKPKPTTTTECGTSPTGSSDGQVGVDAAGPIATQTVALPDAKWEEFVAGLQRATAFNYFDHLLKQMQMHETLEKAKAYQLRMSVEDPLRASQTLFSPTQQAQMRIFPTEGCDNNMNVGE